MQYPKIGVTYTLRQIESELHLRDMPCLLFMYKSEDGVHREVIQNSHVTAEQTLSVPGFADTKWKYLRTTDEWIPLFLYGEDNRPITDFVDMEKWRDPFRREDERQGWWVTPKGFPQEQYYKED